MSVGAAASPPLFGAKPNARADLKPGTVYAVTGEIGWIYYGQVTPEKNLAFFRRRDRIVDEHPDVAILPVMAVITVMYPSITRALRSGCWRKLGVAPAAVEVQTPRATVQWPVATLDVTVMMSGHEDQNTTVDDPSIQSLERAAAWDAEYHIPARLTADYGAEEAQWSVGGPIWRERQIAEEMAARHPDAPWHQLPVGWVRTA